jgi:2-keto-4-pentenoate hydratase/2-oxohepta-3-ene-1,7-dioic acid hydratase in catechol pathway
MKLARYGRPGKEKPALIDADGKLRDLSGRIPEITPDHLTPQGLAKLSRINPKRLPLVKGRPRMGVPWTGIGKIMCIGLNYVDHAKETGNPLPKEPILFLKANSALNGPNDTVMMPKGSKKSDWEVELGVVIGTAGNNISQKDALSHVAGYTVVNDVSEREWQIERGPTWTKGKSCDTFCPIGPWLVTADEVPNPQRLGMWLDVNGTRRQTGNTKTMIFGVAKLISYLSKIMTLYPGDVISTGTPPGVGSGFKPPIFLRNGDVMALGIDGLGQQRQKVVSWKKS